VTSALRDLFDRLRKRAAAAPEAVAASSPRSVPPAAGDVPDPVAGIVAGIVAELQRLSALARSDPQLRAMLATDTEREEFVETVEHYALQATVRAYVHHFRALVVDRHPRFASATGLDFGCWYGLSTLVLRRLGAPRVYGSDVIAAYIPRNNRWRELLGVDGLEFVPVQGGTMGRVALPDASVDWAVANDVFSFAHPDAFPTMVADIHRLLRPGGVFFFSDENNPHFDGTVTRLAREFRRAEIGTGTLEQPDGEYFHARRRLIAERFPALGPATVARHAADTAYLWGEEITRWVEAAERGERPHPSRFEPEALRVPVAPVEGCTCGTVTDPRALVRLLREAGFRCELRFDAASREPEDTDALMTRRGRFHIFATRAA